MLFTKLVKELIERLARAEAKVEELEKKVKRLEKQRENDSWNVQRTMTEHSRITSEIAGLQKDVRQFLGKPSDNKNTGNGYAKTGRNQEIADALCDYVLKAAERSTRTARESETMVEAARLLLEK